MQYGTGVLDRTVSESPMPRTSLVSLTAPPGLNKYKLGCKEVLHSCGNDCCICLRGCCRGYGRRDRLCAGFSGTLSHQMMSPCQTALQFGVKGTSCPLCCACARIRQHALQSCSLFPS
jgi:hypothetical protein